MNEPIEIPNKSSFKINEVCALTGVKSYVLRFWESEFTEIAPLMSGSGLKLYSTQDIEAILLIKKLLFDDKLTIERAKGEMKILMPKVNLVEENFNDYEEDVLSMDYFDCDDVTLKSTMVSPSKTTRTLIDSDIQKLVMAKSKLTELLALTETLNQKNNWN
jgi:DNA-binding transcriptional MerR regulator